MSEQPTRKKAAPQASMRRRVEDLERRTREHAESISTLEQQHAVLMNDVRWILKSALSASAVVGTIAGLLATLLGGYI